jgi:hypothetical protein
VNNDLLRKRKVIKVIPTDEALADSEADGCWVPV